MNRPNDELRELSHYADRLSSEVNEYRNILTFYRKHIMWEADNGLMENGLDEEEVQDYRQKSEINSPRNVVGLYRYGLMRIRYTGASAPMNFPPLNGGLPERTSKV
ncbi:MAG: hypothetical protein ABEJ07_04745 [Candidatus Nanohaloarchaea archaeon]